jgi:hypothetical protein
MSDNPFRQNNSTFDSIPIVTDPTLPYNQVLFVDRNGYRVSSINSLTEEEREVLAVADRLLGRSNALTLETLQAAVDAIATHTHPTTILMSPATRREYLKLLAADRRYP